MKKILTLAVAMLMAIALAAPAMARSPKADAAQSAQKSGDSIATIATVGTPGEFDLLVAALGEAGLVGAIESNRQKTVFAPTDQAFINTFSGLLDAELTEADVKAFIEAGQVDVVFGEGALATILTYHVIPGRQSSNSVLARSSYRTFSGQSLSVGELVDAGVNPANIGASNGVIHVLTEGVLIPNL